MIPMFWILVKVGLAQCGGHSAGCGSGLNDIRSFEKQSGTVEFRLGQIKNHY